MRCFIAIELPDFVMQRIAQVIDRLRPLARGVRWTLPSNVHLTLKFLGEIEARMVNDVSREMTAACSGHRPFSMMLRGVGAFPSARSPRVLWIGVERSNELFSLYEDLETAMERLGHKREDRKFSPHLTLGRVRDERGFEGAMIELATFEETVFGTIEVIEIALMQSTLKPSGAEHSRLFLSGLGIER